MRLGFDFSALSRYRHRRALYGRPDYAVTILSTLASDLWRHGGLGLYKWRSRRIVGWMRGPEADALLRLSRRLPPGAVIVEIGSFLGCSTVILAGSRRAANSGMVHSIDPFDASGDAFSAPIYAAIAKSGRGSLLDRFRYNLRAAGVEPWVTFHQGRAEDIGLSWTTPIDLLLFDGHHTYEVVRRTYDMWAPHLRDGGCLLVHNSRPGYREDTHDGSSRLVAELINHSEIGGVERIESLTIARRLPLERPS